MSSLRTSVETKAPEPSQCDPSPVSLLLSSLRESAGCRLGRKLFCPAHASSTRAVHREVLIGQQPRLPGLRRDLSKEGDVPLNSRSRFFVNTVTSQIGSSCGNPTNQRNSRLYLDLLHQQPLTAHE